MLCDRVLGRLSDRASDRSDAARSDWIDLAWDECHRRALSKTTRGGRNVRLLPRLGTTLRHGDILADNSDCLLIVEIVPVETLVAYPNSTRQAIAIGVEWGNLHVPVQVLENEIVTLVDGPAQAALAKHDVYFRVELRRFEPMPIDGVKWTVSPAARDVGLVRQGTAAE